MFRSRIFILRGENYSTFPAGCRRGVLYKVPWRSQNVWYWLNSRWVSWDDYACQIWILYWVKSSVRVVLTINVAFNIISVMSQVGSRSCPISDSIVARLWFEPMTLWLGFELRTLFQELIHYTTAASKMLLRWLKLIADHNSTYIKSVVYGFSTIPLYHYHSVATFLLGCCERSRSWIIFLLILVFSTIP